MFVIRFKKLFIGISATLVVLAIVSISIFGLKFGIDFKGGSSIVLSYQDARPDVSSIKTELANIGFGEALVQPIGENGVSIKTRDITDADRGTIVETLSNKGKTKVTQESFTSIGPSVGKELKNKAILSIILVLSAIILFVAYAFRKVSEPVSSWKYGLAVIIALAHDIIIPTGIFAVIGKITGAEVDTLFIVALLTTLALSVSDTIVVFDRVRENLGLKSNKEFKDVVGESISQTFIRSLNTSLTVIVVVVSLAMFGPDSTKLFATVLAIGMFFGTYSSIFLASPLLVLMEGKKKSKK